MLTVLIASQVPLEAVAVLPSISGEVALKMLLGEREGNEVIDEISAELQLEMNETPVGAVQFRHDDVRPCRKRR